MKRLKIFLQLALSATLVGCTKSGGTTSGNPFVSFNVTSSSQTATVAFYHKVLQRLSEFWAPTALASTPPSMVDATGKTVLLSQFWITINQIEFEATQNRSSDEVDGANVEFLGPYSVDMLAAVPQSIGQKTLNINGVRRIKLSLSATIQMPASAPSGLSGNSIFIAGSVNGHAFTFSTSDESEVEIGGPNLVQIPDHSDVVWQLQSANLIKQIDLSSITANTDISPSNRVNATNPCPAIDSSATDLYTCFRRGFETESNLGVSKDGSGDLGPNDEKIR